MYKVDDIIYKNILIPNQINHNHRVQFRVWRNISNDEIHKI